MTSTGKAGRAAVTGALVVTLIGSVGSAVGAGRVGAGRVEARPIGAGAVQQDTRAYAGYSSSGRDVSRVEAEWTIPAVDCSVVTSSRSSIVISLDDRPGHPADSVGTSADCHDGTAHYYGWYQTMEGPRRIMYDPMHAGDRAEAYVILFGSVDLHLNNYSASTNDRAESFASGTLAVRAKHKPASRDLWQLSDFGTVYFTDALIDQQPIGDGDVVASRMVGKASAVRAVPSGLHDDGSFAVLWRSAG